MKKRAFNKLAMLLANKHGMAKAVFYLMILALVVVVIGGIMFIASRVQPTGDGGLRIIPPRGNGVDTGVSLCPDRTVTPDRDINAVDKDNPTTAVTDDKNLWRKKATLTEPAGTWTTWTLGTEITNFALQTDYEFFIPADTTTSNAVAKAYGPYISWNSGCDEDDTLKIEVANDETHDGLSATFYNKDNNAAAQTYSAGGTDKFCLRWKAGAADEYYGHPFLETYPMFKDKTDGHRRKYPNTLCLKLNSTAWEVPDKVYIGTPPNEIKMDRVSAPVISAADGATTHIMYCYEAPVITDTDQEICVIPEADGTNAPTVDDTAYLYCGGIYIDSDTGEPDWGVEDNKAAYVCGNGDADSLTLDFT